MYVLVGSFYTCPSLRLSVEWWGFPPWWAGILLSSLPHWISGEEKARGGTTLFWRLLCGVLPCVRHYLLILQKPNAECFIQNDVFLVTANSWHNDHFPLLALKLLHRANLHNTHSTHVFAQVSWHGWELITECSSYWPSSPQCPKRI